MRVVSTARRLFYILLPRDAYIPVAVRRMVDHIQHSMGQRPENPGAGQG